MSDGLTDATMPLRGPAAQAVIPGRMGRYIVERALGKGGMGVVLACRDPELGRPVAIKVLRPDVWGKSRTDDAQLRLWQEAQAMAKLSHPNVVTVYEVGRAGDQPFIAMELIEGGRTLRAWLEEEKRSWREVVAMFVAAGRGLEAAHAVGLVHRDFKPENVLVGPDERPRVGDFGLVAEGVSVDGAELESGAPGTGLSISGAAVGTPGYMAPEQWKSGRLDARTDLFAFCVSLWEAVYGVRPFEGSSLELLRHSVVDSATGPRLPEGVDAPRWLESALRRGLSRAPEARWPSMSALLDELAAGLRPRRPMLAIGLAGAAVLGAAVYVLYPARPAEPTCAYADDAIATTWNDEVRARIERTLTAVPVPYAVEVAPIVVAKLARYASEWQAQSIAACEATHIHRQRSPELLDRSTACLAGRRRELAALIDVLGETTTARGLDGAVRATQALAPIADCGDAERLLADVAPPPLAQRPLVDAALAELAAATARYLASGATDDVAARTEAVVVKARAINHAPLLAATLLQRGDVLRERDDLAGAIASVQEAARAAGAAADDRIFALAMVQLVELVGINQRKLDQGELLAPLAAAAVARAGNPPLLRARFLHQEGELHAWRGRFAEAVARDEEAIALLEAASGGVKSNQLAVLVNALGNNYMELGRFADARAALERAQAILTELYGPSHPQVAKALNNLGLNAQEANDFPAALDFYQRSLAIKERSMGATSASVGNTVGNIALVLWMQGRKDEAIPMLEKAIAIQEGALGPEHPEVGRNLINLAEMLGELGRLDESRRHLDRGLAIYIAVYGADSANTAYAYSVLGQLELTAGNVEAALGHAERTLAIRRKVFGDAHAETANAWHGLAQVLITMHRCPRALEALAAARAIYAADDATDLHLGEIAAAETACK